MFSSKAKRAAKKVAKVANKIKQKVNNFANSCELAVERAFFKDRCTLTEQYMQSNATSVAFTLDYMDTLDLEDYFFLNLRPSHELPAAEVNNFDMLRYGIVEECYISEINSYFDAHYAETKIPEHTNAQDAQDAHNSHNAQVAMVCAAQSESLELADSGYNSDQGLAKSTSSGTSSEPTFTGEYGLKEPQGQDPKSLWLIGLCTDFLPVLQCLDAHIAESKTADGIAHANDIMHIISDT
ncbi:hypothetical protein LPJ64_006377, partial [Coemansia asiatica]